MAIKLEEYQLLWKREKLKSNLTNNKFDSWIISFWPEFKNKDNKFKNKVRWLSFIIDRTIRNKTYNYIETLERSILAHLNIKHKAKVQKLEDNPKFYWSTGKLICALNECKCKKGKVDKSSIDIHQQFPIGNKHDISNTIAKMEIFNNNKITIKNINISKFRNQTQHFEITIDKWLKKDFNSSPLHNFLNIYNKQYRHTFALEILALILKIYTFDCSELAFNILKNCKWLFIEANNIFETKEFKTSAKSYIKNLSKEGKLHKLDYYNLALELYKKPFDIKNKSNDHQRYIYSKRMELSNKITNYNREFISFSTIHSVRAQNKS